MILSSSCSSSLISSLYLFLSLCAINSNGAFSSSDKFFFTECLYGKSSEYSLQNLTFKSVAENITSEGLEFNTRYLGSMEYEAGGDSFLLETMRINTTNYISSNMAKEEQNRIKEDMLSEFCQTIKTNG